MSPIKRPQSNFISAFIKSLFRISTILYAKADSCLASITLRVNASGLLEPIIENRGKSKKRTYEMGSIEFAKNVLNKVSKDLDLFFPHIG